MTDISASFVSAPVAKPIDLQQLERSLRKPRTLFSFCASVICTVLALLAAVPLFSVLVMLVWRGAAHLSPALLTQLPPAAGVAGGGIGNAIVGTLLVVLLAALLSIPFGILVGIYLAEVNPDG